MSLLKSVIKNAINKGVSNAVSNAVESAVKKVVEPKVNEYANKVAGELDEAAQAVAGGAQEAAAAAEEAAKPAGGLSSALAGLQSSLENYATMAAANAKLCPKCGNVATADKKFCPICGEKLPEETLTQGYICPQCGKQNTVGMKFCADCGTKLPAAIAEETAAEAADAAALVAWKAKYPAIPVWDCGGKAFRFEAEEEYARFTAEYKTEDEAQKAVDAYRELLKENGFREAGEYPCPEHLYKKVDGVCYHVDTEHCFLGDLNCPEIAMEIAEPTGGFDYVKPAPKADSGFNLKNLFKL